MSKLEGISRQPNSSSNIFTFRRQCPIVFLSVLMLIAMTLFYVPNEIEPVDFHLPELVSLKGKLLPNNFLNLSHVVFKHVLGPESLAYDPKTDKIYTGSHDGKIFELAQDQEPKLFASLGPENCHNVSTCGRPLGIRLDPFHRRLIVADAYLGLFAVTLDGTVTVTRLFPFQDDSFKVKLFNSVEIISDGVFAVTESSTRLPLYKLMNILLEGSSTGRVYLIDTNRKVHEILAENLAFPNGIQLLKDNTTLIIAETMRQRVLTLNLKTRKVGHFTDRIPGMPDNIRESPLGGYWIGLALSSYDSLPGLYYKIQHWPLLRWVLHKLVPPGLLHSLALQNHVISVRIDESGAILESLQGINVPGLSAVEVLELANGTIYFGNYFLPHARRLERSAIPHIMD